MEYENLDEILDNCPESPKGAIGNAFVIADSKIRRYDRVMCFVSGGSDSDIEMDVIAKLDFSKKVEYAFVNPGLEAAATRAHIEELKERYGVNIHTLRPDMTIPASCKKYGQPFLNKNVSEMIDRMQKHGFGFEDGTYDELVMRYPNCKGALKWLCNAYGKGSRYNICNNRGLKEFLIKYRPFFKISAECCAKSKKGPIKQFNKRNRIELNIYGVRKAEGGQRSTAYKSCFSQKEESADEYRPLFFFTTEDKRIYEQHYGIEHSICYTDYGLKRTGCAGCPFSKTVEAEREVFRSKEPQLYMAMSKVFKDAYLYTDMYRTFQKTGVVTEEQLEEYRKRKREYR